MDPAIRRALAPVLSKGRARTLGDEYDETDAKQLGKGAFQRQVPARHQIRNAVRGKGGQDARDDRRPAAEHGQGADVRGGRLRRGRHPTIVGFHDPHIRGVAVHPGPGVLPRRDAAVDGPAPGGQEATRATRRRRRRAQARPRRVRRDLRGRRRRARRGIEPATQLWTTRATARAPPLRLEGSLCRRRRLARGDAIVALRRLAEALAHLHERGFVHRDVKLENLLLGFPGDLRTLKLADFGFATAASDRDGCRSARSSPRT